MKEALLLALIIAALGVLAFRAFRPNDEAIIRARLESLAKLVTVDRALSPFEIGARANEAASFFSPDAIIEINLPSGKQYRLTGQRDIRDSVMALGAKTPPIEVRFLDIKVELASSRRSAVVHATTRARNTKEAWEELLELKFLFQKINGDWVVARGETFESLRR